MDEEKLPIEPKPSIPEKPLPRVEDIEIHRKPRYVPIFFVLFIICSVSFTIVGYLLGTMSPNIESGMIIDTIILDSRDVVPTIVDTLGDLPDGDGGDGSTRPTKPVVSGDPEELLKPNDPVGNIDPFPSTPSYEPDTSPRPGGGSGGGGSSDDDGDSETPIEPIVYDDKVTWQKDTSIDLFAEAGRTIEPGDIGQYHFYVKTNSYYVDYNLTMVVEPRLDGLVLPMEYRLKEKDTGTYLIGDESTWVKSEDFVVTGQQLVKGYMQPYTLDWRWVFEGGTDELDTAIGVSDEREHIVTLEMYIEGELTQ